MSGSSDAAKQAEVAKRRARAVELKMSGLTYEQIAQEMGYTSRQTAWMDVKRARSTALIELGAKVEDWRDGENFKLDEMEFELNTLMEEHHIIVQHGRIVYDEEGKPLKDTDPLLKAMALLLKIMDRRAKMLGLDSPTKVDYDQSGPLRYEIIGVNLDDLR